MAILEQGSELAANLADRCRPSHSVPGTQADDATLTVFEDFWSRHRTNSIIASLAAFLFLVFVISALVFNAVVSVAENANRIDDERTKNTVEARLRLMRSELEGFTRNNAYQDEAARFLNSEPSRQWIAQTWGKMSAVSSLYDTVAVINAEGTTVAAWRYGKEAPVSAEQLFPLTYSNLAARLRRQLSTGLTAPVTSEFGSADGRLMAIAGAPVTPTSARQPFDPSRAPILLFSKFIDQKAVEKLARTMELRDLSISGPGTPVKSREDYLSIPIQRFDGAQIGALQWRSKSPGTKSLEQVLPLLLGALLVLLLFLAVMTASALVALRVIRQDQKNAYLAATRDSLSGLLNRKGLFRKLDNAHRRLVSNGVSHSLLYLDLDGFKDVNDTYGHAAGDQLIQSVAARLAALAPDKARTARVGGDEFAILVSGDRGQAAQTLAQSIKQEFLKPFEFGGRTANIGASIGIAVLDDPALNPAELVRRADVAMYLAKEGGRNRSLLYDPAMDADRAKKGEMEEELRKALDTSGIELAFQPLVDARSGAFRGMEALARWSTPGQGAVAPETFIKVAEDSGLIECLGMMVLEKALSAASRWPGLKISVNVSPSQLRNPLFAGHVQSALARSGVKPEQLTLEITECFLVRKPERAHSALAALKALGVSIALDDFGVGHASIGYLRQFGIDRLKMDKSLVVGLGRDPSATAILQSNVALAKAFNIPVTAEGVESEEQAILLRLAGCDELQGYYFGRPKSGIETDRDMPARLIAS